MRIGTAVRISMIKKHLLKLTNEVVIDIGCYDGSLLKILNKKNTRIGVDIDKKSIKLGKISDSACEFIYTDGTKLPIKSESIGIVLCMDVMEHIKKDYELVNEISRILKKNGRLLLTIPSNKYRLFILPSFLVRRREKKIQKLWGHIRVGYSIKNIREILALYRLRIIYYESFFHFLTRLFHNLFFVLNIPLPYRIKMKILLKILKIDRLQDNRGYYLIKAEKYEDGS